MAHSTIGLRLAGVALLLTLGSIPTAQTTTITVGGSCSLVDAITAAETN